MSDQQIKAAPVTSTEEEQHPPMGSGELLTSLRDLIENFRASKPNDRSPNDRFWSITITKLEEAESIFWSRIFAKR